jgi:hypothetical protein
VDDCTERREKRKRQQKLHNGAIPHEEKEGRRVLRLLGTWKLYGGKRVSGGGGSAMATEDRYRSQK